MTMHPTPITLCGRAKQNNLVFTNLILIVQLDLEQILYHCCFIIFFWKYDINWVTARKGLHKRRFPLLTSFCYTSGEMYQGRRKCCREHSKLLFAMERIFCTSCCTHLSTGILPFQFSSTESLVQKNEYMVLFNQQNSFFHIIMLWIFTPVKMTCIHYYILHPTHWRVNILWKSKLNFMLKHKQHFFFGIENMQARKKPAAKPLKPRLDL